MKKPNFFIVGAPKCGTTAMNDYLSQHPEIFMAPKEIHYFGKDLKLSTAVSEPEYLAYFQSAKEEKIIGEASVWYLFSKTAAAEIKSFSPQAKILIMLRNPVDMLHSLHSEHLYSGNEDILDFETAINFDAQRRNGHHLPNAVDFYELPLYRDAVAFSEQVKRYLQIFGNNQVHIILYDDFLANPKKETKETLKFLELDSEVDINYRVINSNKQIRFFFLHRLIKKPPLVLRSIVRFFFPFKRLRHAMMRFLFRHNIKITKRSEMNGSLVVRLKEELATEIKLLGKLINRDLSKWLK